MKRDYFLVKEDAIKTGVSYHGNIEEAGFLETDF